MDLDNDLEELRDMTHLLIDDVNLLRPKIGEGNLRDVGGSAMLL